MTAAGWELQTRLDTPLGPGARWTRTVPGGATATATLARGTGPTGTHWELDALAPPDGPRVSGC